VTVLAVGVLAYQSWKRGDFLGLWLTADQQGRLAYENLEFPEAADLFEDSAWKGIASAEAGRYEEAAAAFGRLPTAEGFFNRGNALMKGREYAQAIQAYELAVAEAPEWSEARENLELARYTLGYIEATREASDTGDESEYGADDYKFDNTQDRGTEITITNRSTIEEASAEKWMRSVDTRARDFLRSRFALESARGDAP
jgi:Ca-activated chloride channel family protein